MREADLEHDQERDEEESGEPKIRHEQDQPLAPRSLRLELAHWPGHRTAYRVSTMAASEDQVSHTRSSQLIGRSTSRVTLATTVFMMIPLSSRTL